MKPTSGGRGEFERILASLPIEHVSDKTRERHHQMLRQAAAESGDPRTQLRRRPSRRLGWASLAACGAAGLAVAIAATLGAFSNDAGAPVNGGHATPQQPASAVASSLPTGSKGANRRVAYCYTAESLAAASGRESVVVARGANPSIGAAASAALRICAEGWRTGRYKESSATIAPSSQSTAGAERVPDLAACLLSTGQVGIFPGGDAVCGALGLPRIHVT